MAAELWYSASKAQVTLLILCYFIVFYMIFMIFAMRHEKSIKQFSENQVSHCGFNKYFIQQDSQYIIDQHKVTFVISP